MMLKYLSSKPYKSLCYGLGVSASVFVLSACGGSSSSGGAVPAGPTISVSEASVVEGVLDSTTSVTFTLTLAEASDQATSVDYTTQDGTATSGEDYIAIASTLNFTAGETSATVTVDIVGDDTFEVDEYFALVLSNAQGLELNESSIGKGTIETDEDADSKGYFFGSGTMGGVKIDDLIGLAYNDRLMLFSKTGQQNVLYDIALGNVTGTKYEEGVAKVYVDGINPIVTAVSGITDETKISGTLDGQGLAKGQFEVTYIEEANEPAAFERIDTTDDSWYGDLYGVDLSSGEFRVDGEPVEYGGFKTLSPNDCYYIDVPFYTQESIVILNHEMLSQSTGTGCAYEGPGYTGYASVINDSAGDKVLVYAFSNESYAQFSVMTQ